MPSGVSHAKRHDIDSVIDHKPVVGAVGGNIVTIDPATKLPIKDSGTSLADILGGLKILGEWNANTNTPTLASGVGTAGNGYIVSVAGSTNLDGISDWGVKDIVWFDSVASKWRKIDNTDLVGSVFGRVGDVVAAASDYDASQIDNDSSVAGTFVDDALNTLKDATSEPKQAIGYYVSHDRGTTEALGADGSFFNPYDNIAEAIAKGVANGDDAITIFLDTRSPFEYTATIPSGQTVSISGSSPYVSNYGYIGTVTLEDGCKFLTDNLYIQTIKEAAGISGAEIIVEECAIFEIKNDSGGLPSHTTGTFADTYVPEHGSAVDDVRGMASAKGIMLYDFVTIESGIEIKYPITEILQKMDMDGHEILNLADPGSAQEAATKHYVDNRANQPDVTLAGATPVDSDVSAWSDGNRGHGIGTTGREFYMIRRGTSVKYVEMS